MDEMEEKLGAILGNPDMMQKIMAMAQALGQPSPEASPAPAPVPPPPPPSGSGLDGAMLQKVFALARQSGIDKNQQALLKALNPYLSRDRIVKLEKAMRAAKIASLASTALGSGNIPFFSGR